MATNLLRCAALLLALLALGGLPAPLAPVGVAYAGRDCGGISRPALVGLAAPAPAQLAGGWEAAGPVDAAPAAGSQIWPSVAVGADGRSFYAWQEARGDDPGDIFAAAADAAPGGGRRGVRVDNTGSAAVEQGSPALAITPDGVLHAVWEDRRDGEVTHLYYASSDDGGASWSANSRITEETGAEDNFEPALLAGPNGALELAWRAQRVRGGSHIRHSQRSGGAWSEPATLDSGELTSGRARPRLALAAGGALVAAWEDAREDAPRIYVARRSPAGVWGEDTAATPAGADAIRPSIAADPKGPLYIAYEGAPGIFLTRSDDGGATWAAPRRVDDGDGGKFTSPQVAVDALGGVHCIWCQLRPDVAADIVASRSTDRGASWEEGVVLASSTGTANPLGLAADSRGQVYAAWSDDRDDPLRPRLYRAVWMSERIYLPALLQ